MKFIILVLVFVAVVYSGPGHDHDKAEDLDFGENVLHLDNETYDSVMKESKFLFAEFYAPWYVFNSILKHKLAPEMKIVGDNFEGHEEVVIASINCIDYKNLCEKHEIRGFPTLKFFSHGELVSDFQGDRTGKGIINWINKKSGPATFPVTKFEEVKAKQEGDNTVIVGFFGKAETEEQKLFLKIAQTMDSFVFGEAIGLGEEALKEFGLEKDEEAIIVYRTFTDEPFKMEVTADEEKLKEEINQNAYPLVGPVDQTTIMRFHALGYPLVVAFVELDGEDMEKYVKLLEEPAVALAGKVSFGYSDAKLFARVWESMGGSADGLPGIGCIDLIKQKQFIFEGEHEGKAIEDWALEIVEGKVEVKLKSQPIPETNDEPVVVVVGESFMDIVHDDTKDVLIEFYAPWCGHCKKFMPTYDEFATLMAPAKEKLIIAKIDGSANDSPDPNAAVKGFPTIFYYPAGKKDKPVTYSSGRDLKGLKKFILKNAVASKEEVEKILSGEEPEPEPVKEEKEEKKEQKSDEL